MKTKLVSVLTKISVISAIVLASAFMSAQAQSLETRLRVNIPFDFSVSDKKLPSGKYSVGRARLNSDDSILSIADEGGQSKAFRTSIPVQTWHEKDKGTLVFHRYGDEYFLFQVWPAGETTGRQFLKTRREREIERNLANSSSGKMAQNVEVETVTVVGVLQ